MQGQRDLSFAVVAPEDASSYMASASWATHALSVDPRRVLGTLHTPGWEHRLVTAERGGEVVAVLPASRPKGARFSSDAYDPRAQAPQFQWDPALSARDFLLIGGHFDLSSGSAVRRDLEPADAAAVRCGIARSAFAYAGSRNLTGVALYLSDAELREWTANRSDYSCHQTKEFAAISLTARDWDGYQASLNAGKRSVVVRDVRRLHEEELRAVVCDPLAILAEAAPIVVDVKTGHGVPDHPQFVEYRMGRWAREGAGDAVAFALRSSSGELLSASFGRCEGPVLEMYEIGLRRDIPNRGLVYAETLFYAPLRYALARGCTQLRLGCDSVRPKKLRGADITPLWAVAPHRTPLHAAGPS